MRKEPCVTEGTLVISCGAAPDQISLVQDQEAHQAIQALKRVGRDVRALEAERVRILNANGLEQSRELWPLQVIPYEKIGRASCRERGEISVGGGVVKK